MMKLPIALARRRSAGVTMQWASTFVLFVALPQAEAFAEVCDKVATDWARGDPPSGLLGFVAMVALALACALAWYTRNLWVSALCACICVLLATAAAFDVLLDHPLYRTAVMEGCRSRGRDALDAFVLLAGAAFFMASGWTRRRKTS